MTDRQKRTEKDGTRTLVVYEAHALSLGYPLSPVAAFWFVAIVPSSYLAGVIAFFSDERLALSFRRHLARQNATNTRAYTIAKPLV